MMTDGKTCSCCQKFKFFGEFYRQADRIESVCKDCKQRARKERKNKSRQPVPCTAELQTTSTVIDPPKSEQQKAKSYEDYGLTRNDFLEIVEFFRELMRLDKKG